jgi:hypothetical protein
MREGTAARGLDDGAGGDSNDGDMTNERFRLLAERALRVNGDFEATSELNDYLLGKLKRKAMTFPAEEREEAVRVLITAGWKATVAVLSKHVDRPRNYAVRSITLAYIDLIEKYATRREHERLHDFNDSLGEREDPRAQDGLERVHVLALLRDLRRQAPSAVQLKVAEALTMCVLQGVTVKEACILLSYGHIETETVERTIRRDRARVDSPLHGLVTYLRNDDVPETRKEEC